MSVSGINLSTLATQGNSGIDVQSVVNQILSADSVPVELLDEQRSAYTAQTTAWQTIENDLGSLQTAVNALNDPTQIDTISAQSSNTDVLNASATSSAVDGTHTITVNSLATTSSYYTAALSSSDATFGTGSFEISIGGNTATQVTVDSSNDTLSTLAASINQMNLGVTASIINDASGARLALVSSTTGTPGDITVSGNTTGLSFTKAVTGSDASLTVDGIPITSATNTVSGVISGVTLDLAGAAPDSPVTLTVAPDTSDATTAINNFVTAYNQVVSDINAQYTVTAGSTSGTNTVQPLESDATLGMVQQQLLSAVNYSMTGNNGIVNLASIGVTMNDDGTLSVDTSTLDDALTNNFASVQNFLQQPSPQGFALNLSNVLMQMTDPSEGPIALDLQGISESSQSLSQQISEMEANLTTEKQNLTTEYSQVDATLQQLPALENEIAEQLGQGAIYT